MRRKMLVAGLALGALGLATACGSSDGSTDDPVYQRTIAMVNPDGTLAWSRTESVMASQQAAEVAARRARDAQKGLNVSGTSGGGLHPLSVNADSSCADSDNWLFDGANDTGNELCLYGTNPTTCAAMNTFSNPTYGNWQNRVASFYTGNETGYFECGDLFCPSSGSWSTYTDYTSGCATCSYTICFTD